MRSGDAQPAPAGKADLRVSAAFDKQAYAAADRAAVTVTITNAGEVAADGVHASGGGDLDVWGAWGDLGTKAGVRIAPHTVRTVRLSGRILHTDNGKVTFSAKVTAENGDADATSVDVPLTLATAEFGGVIFVDRNENGTVDAGEGLSGAQVSISGGTPNTSLRQGTDSQGRFAFHDIPQGHYDVDYSSGTQVFIGGLSGNGFDAVDIDGSGKYADVSIEAFEGLSLRVTMAFDKAKYEPGDTTKATVRMDNFGTTDIHRVTARCRGFAGSPDLQGGPGWGALADGAAGVDVPAGKTVTAEVTEAVPDASPRYGYVSAFCFFGPQKFPDEKRSIGTSMAAVSGEPTTARGQVAHDLNGNFTVDDGEQLTGVRVAIADRESGVVLGNAETDGAGLFEVPNILPGIYDLRVLGPWKGQYQNLFNLVVVAGDPFVQSFFVEPGTGQEDKHPNLRVSAEFDKPAYESGDTMHVKVTVSNVGEADAEQVRASFQGIPPQPDQLVVDPSNGWGELLPFGNGTTVRVGETRVFDVFGTVSDPDAGRVRFADSVLPHGSNLDSFQENNSFDIEAPVTKTTGTYSGTVFADRNGNGTFDPGEGLPGIQVGVFGGVPHQNIDRVTSPDGTFEFADIPTGHYGAQFEDPTGTWVMNFDNFQLDKSGHTGVFIRAIPPLSAALVPTIKFAKGSYVVGEVAHLTVTLVNKGAENLTGITATCGTEGGGGLRGGSGWGPLAEGSAGVSLPAHSTQTVQVSEAVPQSSHQVGFVAAFCTFGATGHPQEGSPFTIAFAKVPTDVGNKSGKGRLVRHTDADPDGAGVPVPGVKVVLLDIVDGHPVAKTRTDADGRFVFANLPVGVYRLRVVGPWRIAPPDFHSEFFIEGDNGDIVVEAAPDQADPFPDTTGTPAPPPAPAPAGPQPQGSVTPAGLASTGASVVGPIAVSLGLLVAGLGAVLFTRRRRESRG